MAVYYNEIEPFAVAWLRVLIAQGLIADGDVDDRSIEDVTPSDIAGYTQCHFFAGIGGWSYALRLSGWPDSRPCWTLSCPCQPFSAAGKGGGFADERHLWPAAHWLISQRRPVTIFGEQVASPAGLAWFDSVYSDLERTAYTSRAVDLCAASIGAPHIRQRLYFRADSQSSGVGFAPDANVSSEYGRNPSSGEQSLRHVDNVRSDSQIIGRSRGPNVKNDWGREFSSGYSSAVGFDSDSQSKRGCGRESLEKWGSTKFGGCNSIQLMQRDDSIDTRLEGFSNRGKPGWLGTDETRSASETGATRGWWGDCDWWHGKDEKYRPIEPGLFPLASGISGRMGKLRGFGNSIVPWLAAEFIQANEEA